MKQSAPCCLRDIFKIENLKKKVDLKRRKNLKIISNTTQKTPLKTEHELWVKIYRYIP